jgi:hypothetical protein
MVSKTGLKIPKSAFKAGADVRRNLRGRPPRGHSIADKLRELSDPERIAKVVIKKALAGDSRMMQILLDRTEGKAVDVIMNISETFQESDIMADRTLLWLTKFHPKLVKEWAKAIGLDLALNEEEGGLR